MTATVEGSGAPIAEGDSQRNCTPTQYLHLLRHRHPKISRRRTAGAELSCRSLVGALDPDQCAAAAPPPPPPPVFETHELEQGLARVPEQPCDSLEALCLIRELQPMAQDYATPRDRDRDRTPLRSLSVEVKLQGCGSKSRSPERGGKHGPAGADRPLEPRSISLDLADLAAFAPVDTEKQQCPHCTRWFATAAAARHIPICSKVTRPRPPGSKGPLPASVQARASHPLANAGYSVVVPGPRQDHAPAASASASMTCAGDDKLRTQLGEEWGRIQLLLRKETVEVLRDGSGVTDTLRVAEECINFLGRLEECAKRLGMRKGQLSRLLLPYDSNTSTSDQASSASDAPLGGPELDGRLSNEERRRLVAGAVMLRRFVRVKLADCADIDQACASLGLVAQFLRTTQQAAQQENFQATALLRDLPADL